MRLMRLDGILLFSTACSAPAPTVTPSSVVQVPTVAVTTPPPTPEPATPERTVDPAAQRLPLVAGPPRPLEAGTYLTPDGFEPAVSITVPDGWYGGAGRSDFSVGQGLNEAEQRYADAGLYLGLIDLQYDAAVATFGDLQGVEFTEPSSSITLDGHEATVFHANPIGDQVVLDEIAPGADLHFASDRQILIDVDEQTLLIRTELFGSAAEPSLTEVIGSIRFP